MESPTRGMESRDPFDRVARRRARDRAAGLINGRDDLIRHVADELRERQAFLGPVPAGEALWIGLLAGKPAGHVGLDPSPVLAALHGGLAGDEDQRHFEDGRFVRVTAFLTLHGVNDLPGALILCRAPSCPADGSRQSFQRVCR